MIEITPAELHRVKVQLNAVQKRSHFVIFESYDPKVDETLRMITDYQSYLKIQQEQDQQTPMRIVRDIVPVTDHLAMWAISENEAARAKRKSDVAVILKEVNYYINQVLKDNKLPANR